MYLHPVVPDRWTNTLQLFLSLNNVFGLTPESLELYKQERNY